jgi:hypothetical protein
MNAIIGTLPRHYERLGLVPGVIQPWEDGLRTAAADGTFEWWYFDAHLDDGSTVTVEFHTKPPYVSPKAPLTPFVLMTVTKPDGTRTDLTHIADPAQFAAATECCDVTIGRNTFRADGGGYVIHVEFDDVVADFTLRPEIPAWRPETGHVFFGEREEHYIAWLPVAARGAVDAVITIDGRIEELSGTGYHDHNWGNIAPRKILDHWYWGRARVGDYTVVSLMFVSHNVYGKVPSRSWSPRTPISSRRPSVRSGSCLPAATSSTTSKRVCRWRKTSSTRSRKAMRHSVSRSNTAGTPSPSISARPART